MSQNYPLVTDAQLFEHLYKRRNEVGIFVDIDNTLFDTDTKIFESALSVFGPHPEGLSAKECARRYDWPTDMPHIGDTERSKQWTDGVRRDPEIHHNLEVIPHSVENLHQINTAHGGNARIKAYVSARCNIHHEATARSLQDAGYPYAPICLAAKELDYLAANERKSLVIIMGTTYGVCGVIDDDPHIVECLYLNGYPGTIWFVGASEAPDKYPGMKIVPLPCHSLGNKLIVPHVR